MAYRQVSTLFLNLASVELDFSELEEEVVTEMHFDYAWGGSTVNLQVNGETVFIEDNFMDMPAEIADGVTLAVSYNQFNMTGHILLLGNIEELIIGGGELWLDNFCLLKVPTEPPLSNCLTFDSLYLTVNGPYTFFTDSDFGTEVYNYEGIPILIEPYQVDGVESNSSLFVMNVDEGFVGDLLLQGGGVGFDFSTVDGMVHTVSFDFQNSNNNVMNLQINDSPVKELFGGANDDLTFPDFQVVLDLGTPNQMVIMGGSNIEKLVLAGNGLIIDNVCYNAVSVGGGVWPGDANSDGIANNFDLLAIGLSFGNMGIPRMNQSIFWSEHDAEDWETSFVNGVNHKHADCNGDGTVLFDDIDAICAKLWADTCQKCRCQWQ